MGARRTKFLVGGVVILAVLGYLIYSGVTQSAVYFVTPSELKAAPSTGKSYRIGGMVVPGSLHWEARTLDLTFSLTDGKGVVAVRHKGTPPDLFGEGRGAVVEGRWVAGGTAGDGYVNAAQILAKHSEEYKAPSPGSQTGYKDVMKTLQGETQ